MKPRGRTFAGFTAIELLVAVAIAVVLAGLLMVVTRSALNVWQKTQDRSASNVQAKVALDILTRDLQAAIFRETGEATMAVDIVNTESLNSHGWRQDYSGASKPDAVGIATEQTDASGRFMEASRFGRGGVWFRFLTTNVRSGGDSGPEIVSYQINRRPISGAVTATNPPAIRYTLFRDVMNGADTFAAGYAVQDSDGNFSTPSIANALCDNVVDFGMWCYRRNGDGSLVVLYPGDPQDRSLRGTGAQFPDVVDIALRVLTDSGAAQLEQMEAGRVARPPGYATDEEWWWAFVTAESHVYTARVMLRGRGRP